MNSYALSHAYAVIGPAEQGTQAALELAKTLLCSAPRDGKACGRCENCRKAEKGIHPDLTVISRPLDDKGKPKREIPVDQIRAIVADAAVLPNEAERKVYVIREAGAMNPAAQNALLKILEEPPYFVAFVLAAEAAGALLETVRSRCVMHYLGGRTEEAPPAEARALAERYLDLAAADAKISLISFANENAGASNAEMLDFVRAVRVLLADMLCGRLPDRKLPRTELMRLTELMKKAEEYLRFNVSTKHVLGLLTVDTVRTAQEKHK